MNEQSSFPASCALLSTTRWGSPAMAAKYKHLTEVEGVSTQDGRPSRSAVYATTIFRDAAELAPEQATLYYSFAKSVENYGDGNCLGARVIDSEGVAGDYAFWSYRETAERVGKIASALKSVGMKRGGKVGVFGINCREWMLAMQACNRMSYICVPIYDTLSENAVEYIINHSEATTVFLDAVNLPKLEKALPKIKGHVKDVIYWNGGNDESIKAIRAMKIQVHSFEEFYAIGEGKLAEPEPPKAEDLCTIMYTSGTTGDPKGVSLTHNAVSQGVHSLKLYCEQYVPQGPTDRYISYLPLAHIFDRMGEEMLLAVGASIGYWQGNITTLVHDIAALKPTLFVGVPRVFDRIYNRVIQGVETASFLKKFLFKWGFSRKSQALKDGIPSAKASPFFDKLVFSKVKERLGGRVRLIITGGAPIAPHTEEFLKVCFCAKVVQGYGLTETCAGSFITIPDDPTMSGTVGPPLPMVQFCLESVPDMNYDATTESPIGEVCVKTPFIFDGYYKAKNLTKEVLEENGWFHTGDVGVITPEGALKLVDRKKNILKLSQGEYVAVEKVEGAYSESTAVEQIWVYGDSFKHFLIAVVVPSEAFVKSWATQDNKTYDYATLCKDEELKKELLSLLATKAKEQKLKGFEAVKNIFVENEQFSVDNDLMTPTFKLKRPQLKKKYESLIAELYSSA